MKNTNEDQEINPGQAPEENSENKAPIVDADLETRDYTKENFQNERDALAVEIWSIRRRYFKEEERVSDIISINSRHQETQQNQIRLLEDELRDLEQLEDNRQNKLINRVLEFIGGATKSPYSDLIRERQQRLIGARKKLQEIDEIIHEYTQELSGRTEIEQAKTKLWNFYEDKKQALRELKEYRAEQDRIAAEDEPLRQVERVMDDYGVFIVHATRESEFSASDTVVDQGVSWSDKLRIAFLMQPEISTSTIQAGDPPEKIFGRVGLIVTDGRVKIAHNQDIGTFVNHEGQRGTARVVDDRISLQLKKAILLNRSIQNEIVISSPGFSGIYYCLDEYKTPIPNISFPEPIEIDSVAQELGLPIYLIEGGRVYRSVYDEKSKSFKKGDKVKSEDISGNSLQMSDQDRVDHLSDILSRGVFSKEIFSSDDFSSIEARANGQKLYDQMLLPIKLQIIKYKKDRGEELSEFESSLDEKITSSEKKDLDRYGTCWHVDSYPYLGGSAEVYVTNNYQVLTFYNYDDKEIADNSDTFLSGNYHPMLYFGLSAGLITQKNPQAVVEHFQNLSKKLEGFSRNSDKGGVLNETRRGLRAIGFFCYGVSEQAERYGDSESARIFREFAQTIVSGDEYSETVDKRLKPNGEARILPEDIQILMPRMDIASS